MAIFVALKTDRANLRAIAMRETIRDAVRVCREGQGVEGGEGGEVERRRKGERGGEKEQRVDRMRC